MLINGSGWCFESVRGELLGAAACSHVSNGRRGLIVQLFAPCPKRRELLRFDHKNSINSRQEFMYKDTCVRGCTGSTPIMLPESCTALALLARPLLGVHDRTCITRRIDKRSRSSLPH